jgi:hypothetical protein
MKEYLNFLKKMALGFGIFAVLNACTSNNPVMQAGYPDRSFDLDVLPGFQNPPKGYGNVPFYWWIGDTLTKERILWQLEQLEGMGITGFAGKLLPHRYRRSELRIDLPKPACPFYR